MPGSGVAQSIGSIASEFSKGFMQGRIAKMQEHHTSLQEKQQHIENLAHLSDMHKNNPSMRETIDSQLEAAIHDMESHADGKNKPQKPGGAGGLFSTIRQFFTGGGPKPQATARPESPVASAISSSSAAPAPGTAAVATPVGPAPVSPNSRTFGSLGDMFGQATQTPPMSAAVTGGMPRMGRPENPALATPPDLPPVPSPTATAATPAQPAAAPGVSRLQLPTPSQIHAQSLKSQQTPKYKYYDPALVSQQDKETASEALDEALGMAEAVLQRNPHIQTYAQAVSDPNIGPSFRQIMDYAQRLEGSGYIEKGYADAWKTRFPDIRDPKWQPETLEQKVDRGTATFEERQQHMENIRAKHNANVALSPKEQSYKSAYDQLIAAGKKPADAFAELERMSNAPQQPRTEIVVTRNPQTGQNEYVRITEGKQGGQFTGVPAKNDFDLRTLQRTTTIFDRGMAVGQKIDFDPALVINAARRGDVDPAGVRLVADEMTDPAAKAKVQEFLNTWGGASGQNPTNPF